MRIPGLLLLIGCFSGLHVRAQENDYDKSMRTYRENKTDSAQYYVNSAVRSYRKQGKTDSLVFAYTQKALIEWEANSLEKGFEVMDTAIRLASRLQANSVARVAAYSRMGQLHLQRFELKAAGLYFNVAEKSVDSTANRHVALLYNNIAHMHLLAENYPVARKYAQRAYDNNVRFEGKEGTLMPGILQTLFHISHYSDNLQQALADGLEFQRVVQLHYPPDHPNIGIMHNSLAIIYETLLRYDEALFHRQQAVNIQFKNYKHSKNAFSLASAYHNLGLLYGYIHENYLSAEYLSKGSKLLALTYGEDGAGMVNILVDLAVNKQKTGAYAEAVALFQRAYALQQKHDPNNQTGMAYIESFFGDLYLDQRQYGPAADLYHRSIRHYEKAAAADGKLALLTKGALAKTFSGTGQLERAVALQQEVLNNFRRIYPAGNDAIASILQEISESYLAARLLNEALAYSDSVFAELLHIKKLPENATEWFIKLPFSYHTAMYVSHRSLILHRLYQKTGARQFLIELLLLTDHYSDFIASNLHLFRTQATLIELAEVNKSIYSRAIEACWSLQVHGQKRDFQERAFGYSERSKAFLLRLAANNMLVDAQKGDADAIGKKDRDFRKQISTLNLQYLQADRKDSLLTMLTATMEHYRLFQDSLRKSGNALLASRQELTPYQISEVRAKLLQQQQTLIEYAVTEEAIFTFVLSADTFHVRRTNRNALRDIQSLRDLHGLNATSFAAPAYRLYQSLIKPVEPFFASRRLLVIPDADLYSLNFELLLTKQGETRFYHMPYLIRKYDLSYLLSASSALQFKKARHAGGKDRALLFTPVFTDAMKASYMNSLPDPSLDEPVYRYLYRQPFALQAALQIGQYIAADLFAEQKADERAFKQAAPDYRVLHLGTHAEVNDQYPLQSRLFFAKAPPDDSLNTDDGYLHAYEIYAMQLRAELAVLTACETGAGAFHQGEGIISLAHSFMHAGCPAVLMSLWKIDDKTSAGLITNFYSILSRGKSKSEALRQAKLHYLDETSEALAHPYYWAGLAIIGDDQPIYPDPYRWLRFLAGSVLLAGFGFWLYRHKRS